MSLKKKGYISKISKYKRIYEITSNFNKKYLLFFEELYDGKFIIGDILEFDVYEFVEYGACALNPQKQTNKNFEELKIHFEAKNSICGYIYMTTIKLG